MLFGTHFQCSAYDAVPNVFYSAPSSIANDGDILSESAVYRVAALTEYGCRQADGVCQRQTRPSESALLLTQRVRSNKALLLTKVTKP